MGFVLALLMADLVVPATTTMVRFGAGLTLLQEQTGEGDIVRVLDRQGKSLRVLRPGEVLRRARMFDMTVADAGTVAVSVSTPGTLGPAVQQIVVFGASGVPRTVDTGKSVCYLIAADGEGGYWCLGPVLGVDARGTYDVLTRWNGRGEKVGSYVPRAWFARGEGDPEPFQASEVGPPQLLPVGRGMLVAWLPAGNLLVTVDARRNDVERRTMALPRSGRSTVSLALGAGGVRYALLPARAGGETFLTEYRLHRAVAGETVWKPVAGVTAFPRGSYLLGVDGGAVVVWVRQERRVRWIAIE